ncbi:uncharacterized protein METZ01_LOCUS356695, partial [marine metagenome]
FFSNTKAKGRWVNNATGTPPITDNPGQVLPHSEPDGNLIDSKAFEIVDGVRKVAWTGTNLPHRSNGVSGNEIIYGMSLEDEKRINFDLKVRIKENNPDAPNRIYHLNVNAWGDASPASSYLSFDGRDPTLDLQYYDYEDWEWEDDWDFNFETKQIRIRVYEGNWDAETELLSEENFFPEISFEATNPALDLDSPHTYRIGTYNLEELTSTSYREVDLTDDGLGFGDLVHGVTYNITYDIYDLAGNNSSGNKYTNLKYDVTSPEVGLTYSRDPTSVLDVSGTFTITADFIEGIYGRPKIAINQPGASDLGATNMVE